MVVGRILAITVTIAFRGLLYFHTDAYNEKHVVLVDAHGDSGHNHNDPYIKQCHVKLDGTYDVFDCTAIPLSKDDTVAFGSAGQITLDSYGYYKAHVPDLKRFITRGNIHKDVANQSAPKKGVFAFVSLPTGEITTWRAFKEEVTLITSDNKPVSQCFARYVVLTSNPDNPALIVSHLTAEGHTSKIEVFPILDRDLIFVSNGSADKDHRHFPLYERILSQSGKLGEPVKLSGRDCDEDAGKNQFTPEIRDALQKEEDRSPIGDCGPSGP